MVGAAGCVVMVAGVLGAVGAVMRAGLGALAPLPAATAAGAAGRTGVALLPAAAAIWPALLAEDELWEPEGVSLAQPLTAAVIASMKSDQPIGFRLIGSAASRMVVGSNRMPPISTHNAPAMAPQIWTRRSALASKCLICNRFLTHLAHAETTQAHSGTQLPAQSPSHPPSGHGRR